ncbi:hypothetical protein HYV49_01880 [Candidatus Pacearchaeota archaeon]|nr:hypothetical protein [Candidatus Pacearchaeota archaeon]
MKVLFLCSSNVFRSQIAEAYFNFYSKKHKAQSAALIKPQDKMHKLVVRAMHENGINIKENKSKKVTKEMLQNADVIILMNSELNEYVENLKKHFKPNVKIETWNIPDVIAKETDEHLYPEFVKARDIIKKKVKELVKRLDKGFNIEKLNI